MLAGRRVLFLGITGVEKEAAIQRLIDWQENKFGDSGRLVQFEDQYLWPNDSDQQLSFLDGNAQSQWDLWRGAWDRFLSAEKHAIASNDPIFLSMHGCVLRSHYGVRCPFDPGQVARDFKPHVVITLIDDVYEMWWRTEERAALQRQHEGKSEGEYSATGRPSLEQLIAARRQEILVGDIVARVAGSSVKNLMLSVHHPIQTFSNAVGITTQSKVVYLSFPISQPRKMEEANDRSGMDAVSDFVRRAFEKQASNPKIIVQCPLTIDELPLQRFSPVDELALKASAEGKRAPGSLDFDRDRLRWNLDDLWPADDRLAEKSNKRHRFSARNILGAWGAIDTDVTFRDYRLVDQADYLLVFNPILKAGRKTIAGSVGQEVDYARGQQKKTYAYQDIALDPDQIAWGQLGVPVGDPQMEAPPTRGLVTIFNSVEQLLAKLNPERKK